MSRNKIKNSKSLHWMMVVKYVLIAGLLCVLGLSYILCKNHILHLAEQVKDQERELAKIEAKNEQYDVVINQLKSPAELQRRIAGRQLVQLVELPLVRMDSGAGASIAQYHTPNLPVR